MRLVLDLDPAAQPIQGWLEDPGLQRVPFVGLLELIAAVEAAVTAPPAADVPDK